MVANEFWIHPRGLVSIPGKDVNVLFKELYQLLSLSLVEVVGIRFEKTSLDHLLL